ncbi:MAG: hypothetical protein P4L00_12275 [Candidatus Acidoferrales bacterium]|nr:hypothetical protein [Candidatus Acidoferrales bacterium]
MLSLIIWSCGVFLEALLLFRGLRAKLFLRYPNFYIYVLSLFLSDGLLYLAYLAKLASYDKWSWYAGFLNLFLGCGILLEVFRHVLSRYAGVEKFARIVSFGIMGAVLCFAVIYLMFAPDGSAAHALFVRLQRDFLMVQAILLFGLLQLVSYYGISMGKNLKGMILGYGQTLGVTLIALALRAYIGPRFQSVWTLAQQLTYLAALAIWLVNLWSYCANPVPESKIGVEADYEVLAAKTRDMVGAASTQLVKVNRL